jgi:hypothetical protein
VPFMSASACPEQSRRESLASRITSRSQRSFRLDCGS